MVKKKLIQKNSGTNIDSRLCTFPVRHSMGGYNRQFPDKQRRGHIHAGRLEI